MKTAENLKLFYDRLSELYQLRCINALLDWDQQVHMPSKGANARADQLEYLSLLQHQRTIDPGFARVVDELAEVRDTLSAEDQVNVRETKKTLDIQRKLPEDFVSEMAQTRALSYSTWAKARPLNDFAATQPFLEKIVELNKRYCELVGYEEHPYDALLDQYEPGIKMAVLKPLLLGLGDQLKELIPPITAKYGDYPLLCGQYDLGAQQQLCRRISSDLGFNFEAGRLDRSPHPFMTTIGVGDFRITNRYTETDFVDALYGTIHETGHALYEMGMRPECAGTPMAEAASGGIHESQSRLWEVRVCATLEFCTYLSRVFREFFPKEVGWPEPEQIWGTLSRVHPTLIRTDADEVTYCQHVVIRLLLEEALLMGDLAVADLPDAWDEHYEKYLGIRSPNLSDGVLQDAHWYGGAMGYFPSYALGNIYNAMMMEAAEAAIPNLYSGFEKGEFSGLLKWLRENVHQHGSRYYGPDLIRNITGKELSWEPFVTYLKKKFLG